MFYLVEPPRRKDLSGRFGGSTLIKNRIKTDESSMVGEDEMSSPLVIFAGEGQSRLAFSSAPTHLLAIVDQLDEESFPVGTRQTIQRSEGRVLVQTIFQPTDRGTVEAATFSHGRET
jgi:hypothetical protein